MKNTKKHQHTMKSILPSMAVRRQPGDIRWRGGRSWLASLRDADVLHTLSGGVASLNHRLMAENPPGSASAI